MKAGRYEVLRHDGEDIYGVVSDVDGIRNDNGVGLGINGLLAEVVLEVDTSAEAFFGAETPRVSSTGFIVDEYRE